MYEFIESSVFAKYVYDYLTDEEYSAAQWYLSQHVEAGDLIPGSGGCRKMRWGVADKGKRGGVRVIYYEVTQAGRFGCWPSMPRPDRRISRRMSYG